MTPTKEQIALLKQLGYRVVEQSEDVGDGYGEYGACGLTGSYYWSGPGAGGECPTYESAWAACADHHKEKQ